MFSPFLLPRVLSDGGTNEQWNNQKQTPVRVPNLSGLRNLLHLLREGFLDSMLFTHRLHYIQYPVIPQNHPV